MDALDLEGCLIVYVDTDSVIYLRHVYMNPSPVLKNTHPTKMGAWKNEAPDYIIEMGIFVGPKNYSMIFRRILANKRGRIKRKRLVKIRGFNVKQRAYQALEAGIMQKWY